MMSGDLCLSPHQGEGPLGPPFHRHSLAKQGLGLVIVLLNE